MTKENKKDKGLQTIERALKFNEARLRIDMSPYIRVKSQQTVRLADPKAKTKVEFHKTVANDWYSHKFSATYAAMSHQVLARRRKGQLARLQAVTVKFNAAYTKRLAISNQKRSPATQVREKLQYRLKPFDLEHSVFVVLEKKNSPLHAHFVIQTALKDSELEGLAEAAFGKVLLMDELGGKRTKPVYIGGDAQIITTIGRYKNVEQFMQLEIDRQCDCLDREWKFNPPIHGGSGSYSRERPLDQGYFDYISKQCFKQSPVTGWSLSRSITALAIELYAGAYELQQVMIDETGKEVHRRQEDTIGPEASAQSETERE